MATIEHQLHELSLYTLAHTDPSFIHQHVVDTFMAQTADENSARIGITFSLVGLHLYVEKEFTGRQVQLFHLKMAKDKKPWLHVILPVF